MSDSQARLHVATPSRMVVMTTLAALASGWVACGGGKTKEPKVLPSQTVSQVTPELEAPPPLPPPQAPPQPLPTPAVKVIDPGETEPQPKTLIEASRLAKARKGRAQPPVAEINDENLSEYASGGQLIVMESGPAAEPPELESASERRTGAPTSATSAAAESTSDEVYWRSRGLELRRTWRSIFDEMDRLELEAAAQRQRFYAEDDPYVRDAQVKPAWDRALDRLQELRTEAQRYEQAIGDFLDEGRELDIPPGWLSEGWELEPSEEERKELHTFGSVAQPVDTPIADEPSSNVGGNGGGDRR